MFERQEASVGFRVGPSGWNTATIGRAGAGGAALTIALVAAAGVAAKPRVVIPESQGAPPTTVLHLADRWLEAEGVADPAPNRSPLRWSFAEERSDWHGAASRVGAADEVVVREQLEDGVRLAPNQAGGPGFSQGCVGLFTKLEDAAAGDWVALVVRARTSDRMAGIGVGCNVENPANVPSPMTMFMGGGEHSAPVFSDGSAQEYRLPLPPLKPGTSLNSVGVFFSPMGRGALDLLEISLIPRGLDFPESMGARAVTRATETRHSLYAHVPANLSWTLDATAGARFDVGLACVGGDAVQYRIEIRAEGDGGVAEKAVLLDESVSDGGSWVQRSIDLSAYAGKRIELTLLADGERKGEVAIWGAPILSLPRAAPEGAAAEPSVRPNVIFYVIDGGGADDMSLYRYGRPTTPFLEELAEEGVVFERAFANSTWTQPSTASFMTSLQHSVLGGLRRGVHSTPIPKAAVTFAEHMRAGGWQTASLTSNPNAGRVIGVERGMDLHRDHETGHHSTSSKDLHERFWKWRETYPAAPYWVHFQTTDVHEPNKPVPPFAGRWVSEERREELDQWEGRMWQAGGALFGTTSVGDFYDQALARAGIDRQAFFEGRRGLYDETFCYQDVTLRLLVDRLKKQGEWENTLLVIGADHGHPAGTFSRWGRGLFDPQPDPWEGALFDSYSTRVPLVFVWPGKLPAGRRITKPVSMIDVMPTVLELCDLPQPDVCQGRSLVALMQGEVEEHPPVVLDEFRTDEKTGKSIGNLEIVDGRWGATLQIGPDPDGEEGDLGRYSVPSGGRWGAVHPYYPDVPRLLLYDLEKDPFALTSVHQDHPDKVAHYRTLLTELWSAHQALATQFQEVDAVELTPEQLEALRTLGYIR